MGVPGGARQSGDVQVPTIADLDLDGTMEIIVGRSVVSHAGALEFLLPAREPVGTQHVGSLAVAVANFDTDAFPEILGRDNINHYLFEHDGTVVWEVPRGRAVGGQITVADFDGDGQLEYAHANCGNPCGSHFLEVNDLYDPLLHPAPDDAVLWSHEGTATLEFTFGNGGAEVITAFDANQDGAWDLVFRNEHPAVQKIFIIDGLNGSVLESIDVGTFNTTRNAFVSIADVDLDGEAELVTSYTGGIEGATQVWGGTAMNPLPSAPAFRGQWLFSEAYTSVDGATPATNPIPHWLQAGRNGQHLITPEPDPLIGTQQTFTYQANDGAQDSNVATVTLDILPDGGPPRFLTQPDALTTRGFEYRYSPIVVDPDLGDMVGFQLTASPDGMTIDAVTGVVAWEPDAVGTYPVSILAFDTIGFAVDQSWDLVVGDPVTVPDVIGLALAVAESDLINASLLVGRITEMTHPSIPVGAVSAQTPVAGSVAEFGGDVDLTVSLGPALEDVDNDADTFTENEGDCDDDDNTVFPGAPDPPADGIDQDCDGFDGSEPVVELIVEPAVLNLLEGETVALTAYAIFGDGTSQIATALADWQSDLPASASVSPSGVVTAIDDSGPAQISATLDAATGTAAVNVTASDDSDDDAPTVEIISPTDDATVAGPVDVIGTANDPNLVRYELEIAAAGEDSFTLIGGGTTPVAGAVLGELDPTTMLNGLYTLRLSVLDAGGNQTLTEATVALEGQQKVGHLKFGLLDLEVPVGGIPIRIERSYDSRDLRKGDFGIGWRLGISSIEISKFGALGENWQVVRSGLSSF